MFLLWKYWHVCLELVEEKQLQQNKNEKIQKHRKDIANFRRGEKHWKEAIQVITWQTYSNLIC